MSKKSEADPVECPSVEEQYQGAVDQVALAVTKLTTAGLGAHDAGEIAHCLFMCCCRPDRCEDKS